MIEGAQPLLFLFPPLAAPELEVLLGCWEGVHWVSVDVEVDLLRKVPKEEVPLCLGNVVRVRHRDVMDGIQVLT